MVTHALSKNQVMSLARESELRTAVVVNSASFKCQTHRCWEGLYTVNLLFHYNCTHST